MPTTRVAALIASDAISGPGRQLAALAGAFAGTDMRCLIVLLHRRGRPDSPFERYLQTSGLEHRVVEDGGPLDLGVTARVQQVLDEWSPTVLQTHGYKAAAIGYMLRRKQNLPWIGFFHGATTENLKDRLYVWLGRRLLRAADQVVVMSERQAREFRGSRGPVRIIYNAVLPHGPQPQTPFPALPAHQSPLIAVVSRLSSEKGVDLFIEACALLARKGLAFSAVIAGDGPERAALEALGRQLGLNGGVRFLGHVDNVDALYKSVDLVVLPSRSEGLPNTLLEAFRADVPVVATTVGAIPEVVGTSGGAAAQLVLPGSAPALAEAIERVITGGDAPGAAEARREVVRAFSLERRVQAHARLYEDTLRRIRS